MIFHRNKRYLGEKCVMEKMKMEIKIPLKKIKEKIINNDKICTFIKKIHYLKYIESYIFKRKYAILFIILCSIFLLLFIWYSCGGFALIFSNLTIIIVIPLLIIIGLGFFTLLNNYHDGKNFFAYICAVMLLIIWTYSGAYYSYNLNNENENTCIVQGKNNPKYEKNNFIDGFQYLLKIIVEKNIPYNNIGDALGSINALFSGLALASVAFTIILQMLELSDNRKELRGQKQELASQNATTIRASFENSFFNLLETHRVIAKSIKLDHNGYRTKSGLDAFYDVREDYKYGYSGKKFRIKCSLLDENKDYFMIKFQSLLSTHQRILNNLFIDLPPIKNGTFDSYFRLTYRIVKFIDKFDFDKVATYGLRNHDNEDDICSGNEGKDDKDNNKIDLEVLKIKKNYVDLLRSQIGVNEQFLLFYNVINPRYYKCKYLIEKYSIFNSLRFESLIDQRDILLYKLTSFTNTPDDYGFDAGVLYKFLTGNNQETDLQIINENMKENLKSVYNCWKTCGFSINTMDNDTEIPGLYFKK